MRGLVVTTDDYLHHPLPSRQHHIFEILARKHELHVPHFHVSHAPARSTRLFVHDATLFYTYNPAIHYALNAPYHYHVFRKLIQRYNIEIVVASNVLAGTAAIRAAHENNVPVIYDLQDWFPDSAAAYYSNPTLKSVIKSAVEKIMLYNLRSSDVVTTVSPGLVKQLQGYGIESELILNAVDTDVFKPADITESKQALHRYGIYPKDFVIGFVGSVEPWYNLESVIRAFATINYTCPNTKLFIVGGSLFTGCISQLMRLSLSLGLGNKVIFTGNPVPYTSLPSYINGFDVALIPLDPPQWMKIALPNKFFEYSACGKPIVSSYIPDIDAMGAENVYFYEDYDDFIGKITYLMNHHPTYGVDMEEHSWKSRAKAFEQLMLDLLSTATR